MLAKNREKYDGRVFEKAYMRLAKRPDPTKSKEEKQREILSALSESKLDKDVLERTLPNLWNKQASWMQQSAEPATPVAPSRNSQNAMQPEQEQQQGQQEFNKGDYLLIANMLNQKFHAGIDLTAPVPVLVQELLEELKALVPGTTPEGLAFALKQHQNNFNDYDTQNGQSE